MQELATFTPIINDLHKRVSQYYSQYGVERPDNTYFNQFFDVPVVTPPEEVAEASGNVKYDPTDFFVNQVGFSYEPKARKGTNPEPPLRRTSPIPTKEEANLPKIGTDIGYDVVIGAQDSIAMRHNNPGNLMFVGQKGATKGESRGTGYWAKFENPLAGYQALISDIKAKQAGKTSTGLSGESTLSDFLSIYAPPHENKTRSYINKVSKALKITPNSKIKDIDPEKLAEQIALIESSTKINIKKAEH